MSLLSQSSSSNSAKKVNGKQSSRAQTQAKKGKWYDALRPAAQYPVEGAGATSQSSDRWPSASSASSSGSYRNQS